MPSDHDDYMSMQFEEQPMRSKERQTAANLSAADRLQAGLSCPIPESNKGHQLLMRMGFRPGMGIGKDSARTTHEPVGIDVSSIGSRGGLGLKRAQDEALERKLRLEMRARQAMGDRFRHAMSNKFALRQTQQRLQQAQRACRDLDEKNGVVLNFMWFDCHDPTSSVLKGTFDPVYDSFGFELEYCKDLEETRTRHAQKQTTVEQKAIAVEDKLDEVLTYLRHRYFFCLFCGAKYADAQELKEHCPGIFEQDH